MEKNKITGTLVIGVGIAGINAALKLAESGNEVYLCERKPYIGGTLARLDRWFPDNHCGLCQDLTSLGRNNPSEYCLRQGLFHPKIKIILNCEVEQVEGAAGNFSVRLKIKSTGVRQELCTGCGSCERACPIETANEFDCGFTRHKAIYLSNPLSLLKLYDIDKKSCTKCGLCIEKCPENAVDLNMPDKSYQVEVSNIILSTGFEEFDPLSATAFGYKRYPNVMTSLELERRLSSTGPMGGRLTRPSDGKVPELIAFLQCVGSRNCERDYCSSTCCMQAVKEAVLLKEVSPKTDISIFYMDLRDFGKGYYKYRENAREKHGIKFIQCRVPTVKQDFRSKDLLITSIGEDNEIVTSRFGAVVLSVGQTPSWDFVELCQHLGITTNKWGFCQTVGLDPVATERDGIYVCGSASGPKDIADTLIESTAAAGKASVISSESQPPNPVLLAVNAEGTGIAIFICNCGKQLSTVLDLEKLAAFSQSLPGVVHVQEVPYLCRREMWDEMETILKASGANRAILAACSRAETSEFLRRLPIETVNIREHLAWAHRDESKAATLKAKKIVKIAFEKLCGREEVPAHFQYAIPRALVVGSGLAGLTAAWNIAQKGFEVELLEKSSELGGNARKVYHTLGGGNPSEYVRNLIDKVSAEHLIHLRLDAELVGLSGYAGNFRGNIKNNQGESVNVEAGAIVIATGAELHSTDEYFLGKSEQVITQQVLGEKLYSKSIDPARVKSVVMIQCVGSRDSARPYCSRICCAQALKNALTLKALNPMMQVAIFYRDLMTYGFREEYYTVAREKGIMFFRYDINNKPIVTLEDNGLTLRALDPVLGESLMIRPDMLVLSTAIVPANAGLAEMLNAELDNDGFFKESDIKFRPLDLPREGLFVCGLAHSPRDTIETIAQALATAQRAVFLLSRRVLTSGRVISLVNERKCRGCELCVKACPYQARVRDLEKGVAQVLEHLCWGCGTCVAACPNGAATLKEFEPGRVFSMIDAAL